MATRKRPVASGSATSCGSTPGTRVDLSKIDPAATFGHTKDGAQLELAEGLARLESLQDRLWASKAARILIVLQGIDTAGKDGTVRHVMSAFNAQGCQVTGFGVPTEIEAAHDYLWRHHIATPAKRLAQHLQPLALRERAGGARPQPGADGRSGRRRYDQINDWERMLSRRGHHDPQVLPADRQGRATQAPAVAHRHARASSGSSRHRISRSASCGTSTWPPTRTRCSRCSTEWAPWYVIPSNRNWFRNLAVAQIVADAMDDLKLAYPKPELGVEGTVVE